MKIILDGVGIHNHIDIDILDKGLILLKGVSGSGKTTILESIEDVLYGCNNYLKQKTKTGIRYSIRLSLGDIIIHRQRSPDNLIVYKNNKEFKDLEAQSEIIKIFGTHDEFLAYNYIQQLANSALLNLPPAKMQELIQSLIDYSIDPDQLISIARKSIKECNLQIEHLIGEIQANKVILSEDQQALDSIIIPEEVIVLKPEEKMHYETESTKLNEDIDNCFKKIDTIDQTLKNNAKTINDLNTLSLLEQQLKTVESSEEFINLKKYIDCSEAPWSQISKDESDEYRKKLEIKSENIKIKNMLLIMAESVYTRFPDSANNNITEWSYEKISNLNNEIKKISDHISDIKIQIHDLNKQEQVYKCPHCDNDVFLNKNQLCKKFESFKESINELNIVIEKSNNIILEKNQDKMFLESILKDADVLKSKIQKDPLPDLNYLDVGAKMADFVDYYNNQIVYEKEYNEKKQKLNNYQFQIENIKTKIYQLGNVKKEYIDENKLKNMKKELYDKIQSNNQSMQTVRNILDRNKHVETLLSERNHAIRRSSEIQGRCNRISRKIQEAQNSIKVLEKTQEAQIRLIEIIKGAANKTMESLLSHINISANEFMSEFFEDTQIILNSHYTNTQGKESAKLNTEIHHKGNKYNKIKELSGGERSRAILAFCLGLSSLSRSPLILIDEGLTGLDKQDKEKCLQKIKDISENKIVLFVEHDAPEHMFDQIIEVN